MHRPLALVSSLVLAACAGGSAAVTPIATLAPAAELSPETLEAISALCSAEDDSKVAAKPDLKFSQGMGTGGFRVDTASAEAQQWFDYGLALSHAFYHKDAKAAMRRAVLADPSCSLCAWGEAWALGPTLNYGVSGDGKAAALDAARRARSLAKPGDALAVQLADAMIARYQNDASEPAFGQALAKIAAAHPDNLELAVLAAHSLMIPVRAGNEEGLKPALVLLEAVLKQRPDDTGAIHFYIHGTEFDGRAEDAIAYAEKLGRLAPRASHLVHMPAHTFFAAGRYQEAATVNAAAIEADMSWAKDGGDPGPPMAPGLSRPMYYAHNLAFGLAGALMSGDGALALRYAEHAGAAYPTDAARQLYDPTPRTYVALARHAPDRMIALPAVRQGDAEFRLYHAYARGEAFLAKGDVRRARRELDALRDIASTDDEKTVAAAVLEGRIAMAEGKPQRAAQVFATVVDLQAEMDDYMDPPSWWYPVRRSVAAAWLKAGDFARAEEEARLSLAAWKQDPLALWVLGKAQLAQGRASEGEATLARARDLWRGNFDAITVEAI